MEERILIEKRTTNVSSFDIRPSLGNDLDSINLKLFADEYLPQAIDKDVLLEDFLEYSIIQQKPIPVSALKEETKSNFPKWAIRELLMNAIMHRDYESNTPIKFYQYADRIEIVNPGGLYGNARPENFPSVNDYRNPVIAEAMKVMGYVNRFNRGIARVQHELEENGNPAPVFDYQRMGVFGVTVPEVDYKLINEQFVIKDLSVRNKFVINQEEVRSKFVVNQEEVRSKCGESALKVFLLIAENNSHTAESIAQQIKLSSRWVQKILTKLKDYNFIERVGADKNGYWQIKVGDENR